MSGKKIKVRATSMVVYEGLIDPDEFPNVNLDFDEYGLNSDNEAWLYIIQQLYPFGGKPTSEDWVWTDIDYLSEEEYNSEMLKEMQRELSFR